MTGSAECADSLLTDASAKVLRERDPAWLERLRDLESVTYAGSLSPSVAILVQIAIHATVTALGESPLRRFVARAREIGVAYEEIVAVFKLCTILGIHGAAQAAPILAESLERHGEQMDGRAGDTPTVNSMREAGKFNAAWESLEDWDPVWLDRLLNVGLANEIVEILGGKTFELLCIAIDANVTHIYHPGTRRHIDAALRIGVSPREILDVIRLVGIQGIRSMDVGIRILEEQYADLNSIT